MDKTIGELIIDEIAAVEAVVFLNRNMEPVWHIRNSRSANELLGIVKNIISLSKELHLFGNTAGASMTFKTSFGALSIRAVDSESLLAIFTAENHSLYGIQSKINTITSSYFTT